MLSEEDVLTAVEAAWTAAYGPVAAAGSVAFVGTAPIRVVRLGPASDGLVRYATVGMSRRPMVDPALVLTSDVAGPRAELVLSIRGAQDSVLRTLAVLASTPAVDGLVWAPDATVDVGEPLWAGAEFSAVLVDTPVLPAVPLGAGADPVQLLPVVPITATELAYRRVHGAAALRDAWREAGTDRTAPRRRGGPRLSAGD